MMLMKTKMMMLNKIIEATLKFKWLSVRICLTLISLVNAPIPNYSSKSNQALVHALLQLILTLITVHLPHQLQNNLKIKITLLMFLLLFLILNNWLIILLQRLLLLVPHQ